MDEKVILTSLKFIVLVIIIGQLINSSFINVRTHEQANIYYLTNNMIYLTIFCGVFYFILKILFFFNYTKVDLNSLVNFYSIFLGILSVYNIILTIVFWVLYYVDYSLVIENKDFSGFKEQFISHFLPFAYTSLSIKDIKLKRNFLSRVYIYLLAAYCFILSFISHIVYGEYTYKFMNDFNTFKLAIFYSIVGIVADILNFLLVKVNSSLSDYIFGE